MGLVAEQILVVTAAQLYRECVTYAAARDETLRVVFGRREVTKQINQGSARAGRICFVPGDRNGKAGQYDGPKMGSRAGQVATRLEICSVHVWGFDPAAPNDESVQYDALIRVENILLNSLRLSAMGRIKYVDPEWDITPVERVFGSAKWVCFELQVPVLQFPVNPLFRAETVEETVFQNSAPGHDPSADEQSCPVPDEAP